MPARPMNRESLPGSAGKGVIGGIVYRSRALAAASTALLRAATAARWRRSLDPFERGICPPISQHVAEASKEGGFLGIGGVSVSEAEKATLTEISSAFKLAA